MIFEGFTKTLNEGGRIEIRGFGSFSVREYGAYTGRNPKTGDKTQVGPKKLPFFKVGKELRARVNG
jgi:integration host factor subunit beta